jgi:SRSO17 transposase
MDAKRLHRLRDELGGFLNEVLADLGRKGRRGWAELYLRGLLLDGRRKSAGAMAERLQRIDRTSQDYEQGLQQFVSQSPWEDRPTRDQLARHLQAMLDADGLLILDDTGFPKQGTHSVGVGRQYSGTLGKVGNCQVAVSLQ